MFGFLKRLRVPNFLKRFSYFIANIAKNKNVPDSTVSNEELIEQYPDEEAISLLGKIFNKKDSFKEIKDRNFDFDKAKKIWPKSDFWKELCELAKRKEREYFDIDNIDNALIKNYIAQADAERKEQIKEFYEMIQNSVKVAAVIKKGLIENATNIEFLNKSNLKETFHFIIWKVFKNIPLVLASEDNTILKNNILEIQSSVKMFSTMFTDIVNKDEYRDFTNGIETKAKLKLFEIQTFDFVLNNSFLGDYKEYHFKSIDDITTGKMANGGNRTYLSDIQKKLLASNINSNIKNKDAFSILEGEIKLLDNVLLSLEKHFQYSQHFRENSNILKEVKEVINSYQTLIEGENKAKTAQELEKIELRNKESIYKMISMVSVIKCSLSHYIRAEQNKLKVNLKLLNEGADLWDRVFFPANLAYAYFQLALIDSESPSSSKKSDELYRNGSQLLQELFASEEMSKLAPEVKLDFLKRFNTAIGELRRTFSSGKEALPEKKLLLQFIERVENFISMHEESIEKSGNKASEMPLSLKGAAEVCGRELAEAGAHLDDEEDSLSKIVLEKWIKESVTLEEKQTKLLSLLAKTISLVKPPAAASEDREGQLLVEILEKLITKPNNIYRQLKTVTINHLKGCSKQDILKPLVYLGIGAEIEVHAEGAIIVSDPGKNTPAGKANLKKGDIITAVGSYSLEGKNLAEMISAIRVVKSDDSPECPVRLSIKGNDGQIEVQRGCIKKEEGQCTSAYDLSDAKVNKEIGLTAAVSEHLANVLNDLGQQQGLNIKSPKQDVKVLATGITL